MKRALVVVLLLSLSAPLHARTASRVHRSSSARHQFMVRTGYPHGRPGYVVDHIVALACGGADSPANMQWQTVAEAKAKDRVERKNCGSSRPRRRRRRGH